MITPMLRPDVFGALATHAGDSFYEYAYIPEFPVAVRHLRKYDGNIFRWWDDFRSRVSFTKPEDMSLLGLLGVAACFSARDDGTPELPFDPVAGALWLDVWQRLGRNCTGLHGTAVCSWPRGPRGWPTTRRAWASSMRTLTNGDTMATAGHHLQSIHPDERWVRLSLLTRIS